MTSTWARRNAKDYQAFVVMRPSAFARHSVSSTASSWRSTPRPKGLQIVDRDPQAYVNAYESTTAQTPKDTSLGIGSLKGQ
jgi:hypothetical protein